MKTPHTKEPWFAVEYAGFISIQDGPHYENRNLLDCSNWKGEDILDEETIRANGQRIVECVNAMTGIKNPAEYIKSMQADRDKELIEYVEYDRLMIGWNEKDWKALPTGGKLALFKSRNPDYKSQKP